MFEFWDAVGCFPDFNAPRVALSAFELGFGIRKSVLVVRRVRMDFNRDATLKDRLSSFELRSSLVVRESAQGFCFSSQEMNDIVDGRIIV